MSICDLFGMQFLQPAIFTGSQTREGSLALRYACSLIFVTFVATRVYKILNTVVVEKQQEPIFTLLVVVSKQHLLLHVVTQRQVASRKPRSQRSPCNGHHLIPETPKHTRTSQQSSLFNQLASVSRLELSLIFSLQSHTGRPPRGN